MDFETSDDRRMLADTLARFLAEACPPETRATLAYTEPFHDSEAWAGLAELGVLMAFVPEDKGGLGGGGFDVMTVFEQIGRALSPEPVLPALMAARLLLAAGMDVEGLMSGEVRYAAATGEPDAPWDVTDIAARAERNADRWTLTGRKSVVYGGNDADRLLIAARTSEGLSLFEVSPENAEVIGYGMIDGGGAAEVILDATPATLLIEGAEDALNDALDHGRLALCAEAVGAMDHVQALTLDYLKTRQQFGRPIGKNQALQHRMVDLMTEIEQARSITILAASRMAKADRARTVAMAKHLVGRIATLVAEEAIQMHGGIAMTWEYPVSHYAKRLVMIDHQLGDTDFHLSRLMDDLRA